MSTLVTTTAQIGTIKDAAGNANAMTIDSGGRPVLAGQACVAVQCTNTGKFGEDHSNTVYDISYKAPLPTFTSATTTTQINRGGMTLTFPSYAGGNYAKIVVPVTGVYEYHFYGAARNHVMSDWWTHGLEVNNETASGSSSLTHNLWNFQLNNSSDQNDDEYISVNHCGIIALDANDYVVPFVQSVQNVNFDITNNKHGFILRQI